MFEGGDSAGDVGVDDAFLLCKALYYASRVQKINSYRAVGPKEMVI